MPSPLYPPVHCTVSFYWCNGEGLRLVEMMTWHVWWWGWHSWHVAMEREHQLQLFFIFAICSLLNWLTPAGLSNFFNVFYPNGYKSPHQNHACGCKSLHAAALAVIWNVFLPYQNDMSRCSRWCGKLSPSGFRSLQVYYPGARVCTGQRKLTGSREN